MPLSKVNRAEFKLPLAEFAEKFGITGKITNINYYHCQGETSDPRPDELTIIVVN